MEFAEMNYYKKCKIGDEENISSIVRPLQFSSIIEIQTKEWDSSADFSANQTVGIALISLNISWQIFSFFRKIWKQCKTLRKTKLFHEICKYKS